MGGISFNKKYLEVFCFMPQVNVSIVNKDNIFIAGKYAIFSHNSILYPDVLCTI